MAQLTRLNLRKNQIGDPGITSLADACAKGAMAHLNYLSLGNNRVGDGGIASLANACANGALAQGGSVFLMFNNQATEAGKQALRDAAEARGLEVYFG